MNSNKTTLGPGPNRIIGTDGQGPGFIIGHTIAGGECSNRLWAQLQKLAARANPEIAFGILEHSGNALAQRPCGQRHAREASRLPAPQSVIPNTDPKRPGPIPKQMLSSRRVCQVPITDERPAILLVTVKALRGAQPDAPMLVGLRLDVLAGSWPANDRFSRAVAAQVDGALSGQRQQPTARMRVHHANYVGYSLRFSVAREGSILEQADVLLAAQPDSHPRFRNHVIDLFCGQAIGCGPTAHDAPAPFDEPVRGTDPQRARRINAQAIDRVTGQSRRVALLE